MPIQAPKSASNNLLELLRDTRSYSPETFAERFNGNASNGVPFARTINDKLSYAEKKQTFQAYPLEFAVANRLFHRIPFLFDRGASHEIQGRAVFKTLVTLGAPVSVLRYCTAQNKCHDYEKYPSLLLAYEQLTEPFLKFEVIHKYCFGLSFEAILLEQKPEDMSQADFNQKMKNYAEEIEQSRLLEINKNRDGNKKNPLKAIYLDIIQRNLRYKSYLKTQLIFNKENPIITLLRTNGHDYTVSDTEEFKLLKQMLRLHTFSKDDIIGLRFQLEREEKANPALAGLYFSCGVFSQLGDYTLFNYHLLKPRDVLDQLAHSHFDYLLKDYLSNQEVANLKKNCLLSLNDIVIKESFLHELNGFFLRSPMGTIVRTGTTTRKEKSTGTLSQAKKFCLFGKKTNPPPQQEPLYLNVPPAYNPGYAP